MEIQQLDSIFGLSAGVHLAYTMISDLHWYYLRPVERFYKNMKEFADGSPSATEVQGLPGILWVLQSNIILRRFSLEKRVEKSQYVVCTVAIIAGIMVVFSAFNPETIVSTNTAIAITFFFMTPMPFLFVINWLSHFWWKKEIQTTCDIVRSKYQEAHEMDMRSG